MRLPSPSFALVSCLILLAPACGDGKADDCTPGTLMCSCASGNQCLPGLACFPDVCVPVATTQNPSGNPSGNPTGDPTTSGGTSESDTDTSGGPTSDPTGPTSETETGGSEAGGPQILQFLTNVKTITEGEAVTFTAVVTDPDGVGDVIGGSLTSPDGQIAYGAFATSSEEGAYQLILSWAQIHQADPLSFETPSLVRTFRAEFFDQSGKSAWKTADITLTCDDGIRAAPAACNGTCTDLANDSDHCSTCGNVCKVYQPGNLDVGACEQSTCPPTFVHCVSYQDFTSCADICASIGETCVVGGCVGATSILSTKGDCTDYMYDHSNGAHACEDPYPGFDVYPVRCCCTQTK